VIVGAPLDDTAGPNAGAVYVFDGNTGALLRTFLNPGPGGNDNFGWSVGSAAGGKLLVGAPLDDDGSGGGGAAYLYDITAGTLVEVYLNPTPAIGDMFGFSVAGTATRLIIGASGHDIPASGFNAAAPEAGAAYVFSATTGALLNSLFSPTPGAGDRLDFPPPRSATTSWSALRSPTTIPRQSIRGGCFCSAAPAMPPTARCCAPSKSLRPS